MARLCDADAQVRPRDEAASGAQVFSEQTRLLPSLQTCNRYDACRLRCGLAAPMMRRSEFSWRRRVYECFRVQATAGAATRSARSKYASSSSAEHDGARRVCPWDKDRERSETPSSSHDERGGEGVVGKGQRGGLRGWMLNTGFVFGAVSRFQRCCRCSRG